MILLATGTINIVRYGFNALSGSLVGYMMQDETQKNSLIIEIAIQYATAIGFFSAVFVDYKLKKMKISVDDVKGGNK